MKDEKYIVFKREDWDRYTSRSGCGANVAKALLPLDDAVVIRTQDVFAAPALDGYANAIRTGMAIATLGPLENNAEANEIHWRLGEIADYFHDRACESWERGDKKIPD